MQKTGRSSANVVLLCPSHTHANINANQIPTEGTIGDNANAKGVITCEQSLGLYYSAKHPKEGALRPITLSQAQKDEKSGKASAHYAESNKGWAIASDGTLTWKAAEKGNVQLSRKVGGQHPNEVFAEVCSTYSHLDGSAWAPGVVKAKFV